MSHIISFLVLIDFMAMVISFFILMTRLLPKIWLDEIAKGTASFLLAGGILRITM